MGDASYLFICFFFGLFSSIRSSIIHFDLNNVRMKKTLRFTDNHIFALLLSLIFFWLHLVPVASDGIDADAATLAAATCTRDESPRPHRQRQVFFSINVWIFFSFSKTSFESNFKRITTLPDETFGKKTTRIKAKQIWRTPTSFRYSPAPVIIVPYIFLGCC